MSSSLICAGITYLNSSEAPALSVLNFSSGLFETNITAIICLVLLFFIHCATYNSKLWNHNLNVMLKMAIYPLIITFFYSLVFKLMYLLR